MPKKLKWKRNTFTIMTSTIYGNPPTRKVKGYTMGPFGVHKHGHYWNVTHLKTGELAMNQRHISFIKEAKNLAQDLTQLIDWDFTDKGTFKERWVASKASMPKRRP